ncbi:hypothetical protein [Thermoplasma acidophilum]|uniref:ArnR1-like winged helix-turn-helix domain-containing protein n=1 Tax=Thermoplasma acidophilum (strain ATCC 25905 / DSM 1728 / JCM 9062 / NBRC 15155 / AMRC-C165) TaxID=273075 RepID=Q9HL54_THEAC|nr:hypothetical protein [Thermoplasma acidophilum]MCY0851377.1 hypothetical protein [Thermoplasma acidophilum]CAC11521.1 hypothetical protein [Thermoplasma acidophilum]
MISEGRDTSIEKDTPEGLASIDKAILSDGMISSRRFIDIVLFLDNNKKSVKTNINTILKKDRFSEFYRLIGTLKNVNHPVTKTELINRSCINFRTGLFLVARMEEVGIIERVAIGKRYYFRLTDLGLILSQALYIISPFIISMYK